MSIGVLVIQMRFTVALSACDVQGHLQYLPCSVATVGGT